MKLNNLFLSFFLIYTVTLGLFYFSDEALNHKAKQLSKNFVNRLKLLTVDGRGRSGHSSSAQGLDLVFVLDYSESVGRKNFEKAIEFVESMIDFFGLSSTKEGTHVALIVFADEPKLIFNLLSEKVYKKRIALETLSEYKCKKLIIFVLITLKYSNY